MDLPVLCHFIRHLTPLTPFTPRSFTSLLLASSTALVICLSLAAPASAQITNGLIGKWAFDETAGTTAANSYGTSSNVALSNFPNDNSQWVSGIVGNALHFRGPVTQDYGIASSYTKPTNSISFSGWVYADTNTGQWQSIVKNWGSSQVGQFHFGIENTTQKLSLALTQSNGTVLSLTDSLVLPTNRWVQVGFVADAGSNTVSLYRDGASVNSTAYNGTLLNSPISSIGFGTKTNNSGTAPDTALPGYWQGSFDEFALWDRAVTSTEMSTIYTNGTNGIGIPTSASAAAPEPGSIALLLTAGVPVVGIVRRRKK